MQEKTMEYQKSTLAKSETFNRTEFVIYGIFLPLALAAVALIALYYRYDWSSLLLVAVGIHYWVAYYRAKDTKYCPGRIMFLYCLPWVTFIALAILLFQPGSSQQKVCKTPKYVIITAIGTFLAGVIWMVVMYLRA